VIKDKNQTFQLELEQEFFLKKDVLHVGGAKLKVLETLKKKDKWWWKILRFITFGKFFQPVWHHKVEIYEETNAPL
jgi:hypothetical protein